MLIEQTIEQISRILKERLQAYEQKTGDLCSPAGIAGLEQEIWEASREVGRVVLEKRLQALADEHDGRNYSCACGMTRHRKGRTPKTFVTCLGKITIGRCYTWCPKCRQGSFRFDAAIDWRHVQSPRLRSWVGLCHQAEPYDQGRQLLAELTGIRLSHQTVEAITNAIGEHLRTVESNHVQAIWQGAEEFPQGPEKLPPQLCVAIDAAKAPCRPDWRDVKVATILVGGHERLAK